MDHALDGSTVVVLDSLNYIKGLRYQLYCTARAESTQHCVVRAWGGACTRCGLPCCVWLCVRITPAACLPHPIGPTPLCSRARHPNSLPSTCRPDTTQNTNTNTPRQVWVETGDQALSRRWNAGRADAYPEGL